MGRAEPRLVASRRHAGHECGARERNDDDTRRVERAMLERRKHMAEPRLSGRINVHPRGFGFVVLEDGRQAFVPPPELQPFLQGDVVTAVVEGTAEGRTVAKSIELSQRHRTELFGTVVSRGKKSFLRVDRAVANTDWLIEGTAPADGTLLVGTIGTTTVRAARTADDATAGLERVVVRHAIRATFPQACLDEARRPHLHEVHGRRDLRDVPTLTIDAPTSRDLDDALAVLPAQPDGAVRVLISIADVDAAVPAGSALDAEARLRATSTYLAGRVIPMIPEELSEDALSLLPGVDRLALTVELRVDAEGHVAAVDLWESVIRSHQRLSYDVVASFLDEGTTEGIDAAMVPTLRWLRTASARIGARRRGRGGVEQLREEASVVLDIETQQPLRIDAHRSNSAHLLVERLMVAANEAVAGWLVERGLPGIYRAHEPPRAEQVEALARCARNFGFEPGFPPVLTPHALGALEVQFATTTDAPAMYTIFSRLLGPARYTVEPSAHFGLAAPLYLHFTSPIRRYADLVVHRIVKRFIAGKRDAVARDPRLADLSTHLNERARTSSRAENERLRMLAARLFKTRIGERLSGHIVSAQSFGLVVQLRGTGVAGTVSADSLPNGPWKLDALTATWTSAGTSADRSLSVGQHVDVVVTGTNEDMGRIELQLAPQA